LDRIGARPYRPFSRAKSSKGAHLRLLRQRQNTKGNDSTVQGKTKHTPT